ncbi:hypothetical protein [Streptomyces sp. NBC_00893]|uniref:hypothetical protein n=1 Tax=Streptomyces sp. NBC_00893 TaxID=2975862 RepID=UPI002258F283|nr:hypothetical protein [Streptomyces sp. NBC_00893]MCX4847957.1 hypothetical protein [Streptomyces sp. NBC_00893]
MRSANGEIRRGLLRVGAAYAALVGWLYQDAGDMDGAAFWRGVTQEIAMRSRAPHLVGYSLVSQAHGASPTGERGLVDQLIDNADRLLPRVDDDLPWRIACRRTPGYLEVQRATRYGRLGLGAEAGALWSQVLAVVPETARRDRLGCTWPGRRQPRRLRVNRIRWWRSPEP